MPYSMVASLRCFLVRGEILSDLFLRHVARLVPEPTVVATGRLGVKYLGPGGSLHDAQRCSPHWPSETRPTAERDRIYGGM